MITAGEMAKLLDGREYREEITKEEEKLAKESNLVVVFGASDDLCELRGAVDDELDAYGGGEVAFFNSDGLVVNKCDSEDCHYYQCIKESSVPLTANYDPWTYDINVPYETFNIMEDGDVYCKGIVFRLNDVIN